MVTLKVDETRLLSTIALIENHLDGAVADYERGSVDNVEFIEDLAYMHRLLNIASTHGWGALIKDEYVERIKAEKERRASNGQDKN